MFGDGKTLEIVDLSNVLRMWMRSMRNPGWLRTKIASSWIVIIPRILHG